MEVNLELKTSERIINALRQLEQYMPIVGNDQTVNILTGVSVRPPAGFAEDDAGIIELTFPGGTQIEVDGVRFLELEIVHSARYEVEKGEVDGTVKQRVAALIEHLFRKHDIG